MVARRMASISGTVWLILWGMISSAWCGTSGSPFARSSGPAPYGGRPFYFESNTGQTDHQVRYVSRGEKYTLYLTSHEAVFVFLEPLAIPDSPTRGNPSPAEEAAMARG